jgi:hypothetical protein
LPNPFSDKGAEAQHVQTSGVTKVVNSTLVCDQCFEETSEGDYYESKSLLVFTCPNGHQNEVKIEL